MSRTLPDFPESDTDDGLQRLFQSAVDAYDAGKWGSATLLGGQAVRALAESLVPESSREDKLAAQLVETLEHCDLERPVLGIAATLRRTPDLESHLDGERDDREVADTLIEIAACLIEYLQILPDRLDQLSSRLRDGHPRADFSG